MFRGARALFVTLRMHDAGRMAFAARAERWSWIVKKLSLKIEELEINTFETAEVPAETGTVEAFAKTRNQYTCDPVVGTCFGYTCAGAGC